MNGACFEISSVKRSDLKAESWCVSLQPCQEVFKQKYAILKDWWYPKDGARQMDKDDPKGDEDGSIFRI